jgi:hypothetical protein
MCIAGNGPGSTFQIVADPIPFFRNGIAPYLRSQMMEFRKVFFERR